MYGAGGAGHSALAVMCDSVDSVYCTAWETEGFAFLMAMREPSDDRARVEKREREGAKDRERERWEERKEEESEADRKKITENVLVGIFVMCICNGIEKGRPA